MEVTQEWQAAQVCVEIQNHEELDGNDKVVGD